MVEDSKEYLLHKKAVESRFIGACTVTKVENYKDIVTKVTKQREVIIYDNISCRAIFEDVKSSNDTGDFANTKQVIKLFVASDIVIPEGSKIVIKQEGRIIRSSMSGKPAFYNSHCEYSLDSFEVSI